MGFGAVTDASVLYPFAVRDTILRLAEAELFDLYWSERILDEMMRNLVEDRRITQEGAERLRALMLGTFPESMVSEDAIADLEAAMRNNPKDRHVLAAAVASGSQVVVTTDIHGFPETACRRYGIEAQSPDEFLLHLFHLTPALTVETVRRQADDLGKPPRTLGELLDLHEMTVPGFARAVRSAL